VSYDGALSRESRRETEAHPAAANFRKRVAVALFMEDGENLKSDELTASRRVR
jgi:hypothetical protein